MCKLMSANADPSGFLPRPGKEWTDEQVRRAMDWLQRNQLVRMLSVARWRGATRDEAEDLWKEYVVRGGLEKQIRRHRPSDLPGSGSPIAYFVGYIARGFSWKIQELMPGVRQPPWQVPLDLEVDGTIIQIQIADENRSGHPGESLEDKERERERRQALQECLACMNARYREVLILYYFSPDTLFCVTDLKSVHGLIDRLTSVPRDPVSSYVWGQFGSELRYELMSDRETDPAPEPLPVVLATALNRLLDDEGLYERERFHGVTLRPLTEQYVSDYAEKFGDNGGVAGHGGSAALYKLLNRRNRRLFEDAYPGEVERSYTSIAEVAEELKITETAAKLRLFHGRLALRHCLEQKGYEL